MNYMKLFIFTVVGLVMSVSALAKEENMQEIRAYMAYNFPVDPTRLEIAADMDLSYALASTLVEWGKDKQIISGLCEDWEIIGDDTYRFILQKNAKWSNGEPI